ncbi:DUF4055 domain-containing protein [Methylocystis echinoides]|uniref:DNA-binding protein n=1 Tax=Methylocystis echinoides TaxID=29468 RepID=A0A9W6GV49_9HYPH|nr:DUF4055 domain-containing protein [Methylocystis echinoides]GLI93599.1 DNA-binding protein [Methylocystis echinoides]
MMMNKPTVATPSGEANTMAPWLELIADVRAGLPKMRPKAGHYMPSYSNEDPDDYRRRVNLAPWRPEFSDSLRALSSKPFQKPVSLGENAPAPIVAFADDVDGAGNNLHVFARKFFEAAVADGLCLLLVDHPPAEGLRTVKDYKDAGLKPYWSLYPASSILSLRTARVGARKEIVDLRLRECIIEPDGEFGEKEIVQVRRITPGAWELWRKNAAKPDDWEIVDSGEVASAVPQVGVNAIVLRTGEAQGDLATRPPLLDLAFAQVELWKALSNLAEVLEYSASPMLVAKNVGAEITGGGAVKVGPRACLQCGEDGDWKFIQPAAENIREIRDHAKDVIADMARLAMQPALVRPGATATEVGLQAAKAHSAIEAWALGLKDALQTAIARTIPFMVEPDRKAIGSWVPSVDVHSDFGSEIGKNEEARIIIDATKIGLLSTEVARAELLRRGVINSQSLSEETVGDGK